MPGATPNRGYPYPLGSDPINIAGDVKKLADAIDLDVDTAYDAQAASGSIILGGPTVGGSVGPGGGQVEIAKVDLTPGVWLVHYFVLLTSANNLQAAIRSFVNGVTWADTQWQVPVIGAAAQITATMHVYANLPSGGYVSFNLINNGVATVNSYADPMNHRIHAIRGRNP